MLLVMASLMVVEAVAAAGELPWCLAAAGLYLPVGCAHSYRLLVIRHVGHLALGALS